MVDAIDQKGENVFEQWMVLLLVTHWMHSDPECIAEMRRTLFEAETTDSRGRQRGNLLCRVGTA
jgi:hypothetical protein